jgi:hypothetical protein
MFRLAQDKLPLLFASSCMPQHPAFLQQARAVLVHGWKSPCLWLHTLNVLSEDKEVLLRLVFLLFVSLSHNDEHRTRQL